MKEHLDFYDTSYATDNRGGVESIYYADLSTDAKGWNEETQRRRDSPSWVLAEAK
jgi:hypothetical protein